MPNNNKRLNKEENIFTLLMHKYLPFWPLFATLLISSLLIAWLYLQYADQIFESSATLIIKDEKKGVDDSQIMESMNAFSSNKIVENEIEIIQSRTLLRQVVNELHLYAPIFEDKGIKASSAYTTSPIIVELRNSENSSNHENEFSQIHFSFDSLKEEIKIDSEAYPLNKWVKCPYGELKFLINNKLKSTNVAPLYFSLINPKKATADLLDRLDVIAASKLSTVVNLKFKDPVPQRGEDILNQLIYNYNESAIKDQKLLASNTLTFIEERIKSVESDLDKLEKEIQQYKSSKGVIDLTEQGKLYLQNTGDNNRKIADMNLQLSVLDKVEKYIMSKDNKRGIVPSTMGVNDFGLSQLLQRLYESEIQYEKLSKTTAENNPILVSVANEIEKIQPDILENIQSQRVNLQTSLENLNSTREKYNSALQTIPQKERELLEISRRKAIKNDLFKFLLQKKEETALSYAPTIGSGDSRVVDIAESSILPINPKPLIVYLIAVVVAVAIGITFITGKELFNQKILFRSEIEEFTNVPIVGEISEVKKKGKSLYEVSTESFIMEQFQQLKATIGMSGRVSKKKKVLITSSIPGEGKSFVSTHLARSLALSGEKVILLDFDLRKPNISLLFGHFKQQGIIEYLDGKISPYEFIKPTNFKNLYILPAGIRVGEHTEFLLNSKLEELFEFLESTFDHIIIDAAPVDLVTDAYLLSEYCDITLLLIRHACTPKSIVQRIDQNNKSSLLKNTAIVFNGVKARGVFKREYGYGYGYGYEYVYK